MGCKGPEDVFLPANLAQTQTSGINILQAADFSRLDHFLEPDNGSMIMQDMPDKESLSSFRGQADQLFAIPVGEGQRLFHKDMFAGLQGFFCNFKMRAAGAAITTPLISSSLENRLPCNAVTIASGYDSFIA